MNFRHFFLICLIACILAPLLMSQDFENIEIESSLYEGWDGIFDLAVANDFLYISTGVSGLQIFDLSEPDQFNLVGTWNSNPGEAGEICIDGDHAYVADPFVGFSIVDISDPENPFDTGRTNERLDFTEIKVDGNYLYAASFRQDTGGLFIYNISDPENPFQVAHLPESLQARNVTVFGEYVYVSGYTQETHFTAVYVYNVSEPENPDYIGEFDFEGSESQFIALGNIAYLDAAPSDINGFYTLDISNPENLELTGVFDEGLGRVLHFFQNDSLLYVVDRDDESNEYVNIFNVSDPENPFFISRSNPLPDWRNMAAYNDYIYLKDDEECLILDFGDPDNPQVTGSYSNPDMDIADVVTFGDYAYVKKAEGELIVMDITHPTEPEQVNLTRGGYKDFEVFDNRIFYNNGGGLGIMDVSDPVNPRCEDVFFFEVFG